MCRRSFEKFAKTTKDHHTLSSRALSTVFRPLRSDALDLIGAHQTGATGIQGRQWNLSGVNRAIVVVSVASWQAYIEAVVKECLDELKPAGSQLGVWPALNASGRSAVGRLNTPNSQNVIKIFSECLGLNGIRQYWRWQANTPTQSVDRLDSYLRIRHKVAHGSIPRPQVQHSQAKTISKFFERLAEKTDSGLATEMNAAHGTNLLW